MFVKSAYFMVFGFPLITVLSLNVTSMKALFLDLEFSSSKFTLQVAFSDGGICDKMDLAHLASEPKGLNLTVSLVKYLVIIICSVSS